MKKNLFILLAVVCVTAFAITCNAGAKKTTRPAMPAKKTVVQKNVGQEVMHPVKAVVSQLGNMATEAIFNPTKVTLYQLAGRDTVKKDEVEVELRDGYLTISANKSVDQDKKNAEGKYIRRERYSGSMSRSFYIGENVPEDQIKASFADGILTLTVPKEESKKVEERHLVQIEG